MNPPGLSATAGDLNFTAPRRPLIWTAVGISAASFAWLASRDFLNPNQFFHPHGYCYLWLPSLVVAHVASDALIFLSYLTISLTLVYLVRRTRREIPFSWMFLAFGAFIVACGATHAMEVVTLWKPFFWLAADVKIVTAAASVVTALALPPLVPRVIGLVASAHQAENHRVVLERANEQLESEVRERQRVEGRFRGLLEAAPDAIVIVDQRGKLVLVNGQVEQIFRYERAQLLNRPVELLIPARSRDGDARHVAGFFWDRARQQPGMALEMAGRRSDGSEFPTEISVSPLHADGEMLVIAAIRDVTDRKALQDRLQTSLKEKDLLLKEVHHRVKNNLAVISSLFYLQSTYTRDEHLVNVLEESQHRVRSMALVHERLYESQSLSAIDFGGYAKALVEELAATYNLSRGRVRLLVNVEPLTMSIDLAVPCGLILNELITNTLKHAFPDDRPGTVTVKVRLVDGDHGFLQVIDDGVGVPPLLNLDTHGSLGLRLIHSLGRQIRGTFELVPAAPGTDARLSFRVTQDGANAAV